MPRNRIGIAERQPIKEVLEDQNAGEHAPMECGTSDDESIDRAHRLLINEQ